MKPYLKNKGLKAIALIFVGIVATSCTKEMPSQRKKMPRLTASLVNNFDGYTYTSCGFGTMPYMEYTNINLNPDNYFYLRLNNANQEAEALKLVETFRPFASIYLSQFAKSSYKGIIVDLRNNLNQSGLKENYTLAQGNDVEIPIILQWDDASAIRVDELKAVINSFSGLSYRKTNSANLNF